MHLCPRGLSDLGCVSTVVVYIGRQRLFSTSTSGVTADIYLLREYNEVRIQYKDTGGSARYSVRRKKCNDRSHDALFPSGLYFFGQRRPIPHLSRYPASTCTTTRTAPATAAGTRWARFVLRYSQLFLRLLSSCMCRSAAVMFATTAFACVVVRQNYFEFWSDTTNSLRAW